MPKHNPPRSLSAEELYTAENIAEAKERNRLGREGQRSWYRQRLRELLTVKRLHEVVTEISRRFAHGLLCRPIERRWGRLLVGPIQELRAMLAVDEAATFFVRHAVLPTALSPNVSPAQRRTFLQEMRDLPFSEQGQPLSAFSEAAQLLNPASFQRFNHANS